MKLDGDFFMALAAIAWADGEVSPDERVALEQAAHVAGLHVDDLEKLHRALTSRTEIEIVGKLRFERDEKLFLYGVATWLTRADGVVHEREIRALGKLGDALGLSEIERSRAKAESLLNPIVPLPADSNRDVTVLAKALERHGRR